MFFRGSDDASGGRVWWFKGGPRSEKRQQDARTRLEAAQINCCYIRLISQRSMALEVRESSRRILNDQYELNQLNHDSRAGHSDSPEGVASHLGTRLWEVWGITVRCPATRIAISEICSAGTGVDPVWLARSGTPKRP
jgi:hypothetical protein